MSCNVFDNLEYKYKSPSIVWFHRICCTSRALERTRNRMKTCWLELSRIGGGAWMLLDWVRSPSRWVLWRVDQPILFDDLIIHEFDHDPPFSGEKPSTDWDKAWSNYRKRGRKTPFSKFSPDKFVSWNPKRSNYPLSEEVDPIKRIERSNLMLWTSPRFTLVGAIIIVTFLLVYAILAPVKWRLFKSGNLGSRS